MTFKTHNFGHTDSGAEGASDSLQVAKNVFQIAAEIDDPVKAAQLHRDELRKIGLKTRRSTHKVLSDLFLVGVAFTEDGALYERFARDEFFSGYAKKRPSAGDTRESVMRNLLRYAYDAVSSDSAEYDAALRYAKKLSSYARAKLLPEAVYDRLENIKRDKASFIAPERDDCEDSSSKSFSDGDGKGRRGESKKASTAPKGVFDGDVEFPKTLRIKASSARYARVHRRPVGCTFIVVVERIDAKTFRAVAVRSAEGGRE